MYYEIGDSINLVVTASASHEHTCAASKQGRVTARFIHRSVAAFAQEVQDGFLQEQTPNLLRRDHAHGIAREVNSSSHAFSFFKSSASSSGSGKGTGASSG